MRWNSNGNRDRLWKCNQFAFTVKFQCGKETIAGVAIKPESMMKFQRETDQYSTALNIQNPSVESRFWEEKM